MDEEYRMLQSDLCFYQLLDKHNCKMNEDFDDGISDKVR